MNVHELETVRMDYLDKADGIIHSCYAAITPYQEKEELIKTMFNQFREGVCYYYRDCIVKKAYIVKMKRKLDEEDKILYELKIPADLLLAN
jgi:hypothetical protein